MQNFGNTVSEPITDLWSMIATYVPKLIGALIILIIGWIIALAVQGIVSRLLHLIKVDDMLSGTDYKSSKGINLTPSRVFAKIVFWLVMIVFAIAAADALSLPALSEFLKSVVIYIPNVLVAAVIVFVAYQLASFVRNLIEGSISKGGQQTARISANLAWWAIVIFGIFAALVQLQIVTSIVNIIVGGMALMIAIAGGLAFGLGGRDNASRMLNWMEESFKSKR